MTRANVRRPMVACVSLCLYLLVNGETARAAPPVGEYPAPVGSPVPSSPAPVGQPAVVPVAPAPVAPVPGPVDAALEPNQSVVPVQAAPACFPACRAGFVCSAGQCISLCNPPCENGAVCTNQGLCVYLQNSGEQEYVPSQTDMAQRRERLAYRLNPRFTVHGLIGVGALADGNAMLMSFNGAIGYRQNYAETVGLQVRGGIGIGAAIAANDSSSSSSSYSDSSNSRSDDGAAAMQVFGEVGPVFGPFGRFYIGPMLWASHFTFSQNTIHSYYADGDIKETVTLPDVWKYGAGLDMGILALAHEQLDINWRLKSVFNKEMPFMFEAGVGFHVM